MIVLMSEFFNATYVRSAAAVVEKLRKVIRTKIAIDTSIYMLLSSIELCVVARDRH